MLLFCPFGPKHAFCAARRTFCAAGPRVRTGRSTPYLTYSSARLSLGYSGSARANVDPAQVFILKANNHLFIFSGPHLEQRQVQVKKPHRSLCTTYHGVVPLASCLASAGLAVQEKKGLMEEEQIQSGVQKTRGHTKAKNSRACSSSPGNYDDDDSSMTEAPSTSSESDDVRRNAEGGGAWARAKAHGEKTRGCCTVNVITTFVPHVVRIWAEAYHPEHTKAK